MNNLLYVSSIDSLDIPNPNKISWNTLDGRKYSIEKVLPIPLNNLLELYLEVLNIAKNSNAIIIKDLKIRSTILYNWSAYMSKSDCIINLFETMIKIVHSIKVSNLNKENLQTLIDEFNNNLELYYIESSSTVVDLVHKCYVELNYIYSKLTNAPDCYELVIHL